VDNYCAIKSLKNLRNFARDRIGLDVRQEISPPIGKAFTFRAPHSGASTIRIGDGAAVVADSGFTPKVSQEPPRRTERLHPGSARI
jgi:hypothetical protein